MIATQQEYVVWHAKFEGQEICSDLRAVHASVDVVTKEKNLVVASGLGVNFLEHRYEIVELAVDVSNDDNFSINTK